MTCRSLKLRYRTETINTFVNKRCSNYIDNQKGMINSILERSRHTIVLDRVLITDSVTQVQTLVTDPDALATYVNHHFQNVAGGSQGFKTLPTRWAYRYLPIDRIQSSWYDDILQPPTQEEWSDILRTLPLGKAAGTSGISNEMLCQIGSHISSALWQLVSLCCIHNDIPTGWKHATVYPILKPTDWECKLNCTSPITFLKTACKALIRLINNRLSSIMVKHKILQGGNHAGLPGGSTLEPLRIINAIIEDARANKKELWIMFQDMSKAYDRVNPFMLNLVMARLKFPHPLRVFILNLFCNRKNRYHSTWPN